MSDDACGAGAGGQTVSADADRLLLASARRTPGWIAALIGAAAVNTVATLLLPAMLASATDAILRGHETGPVLVRLGVLLGALTLTAVVVMVADAYCSSASTVWLRRRLLRHVLALGVAGRRRFDAGDLTTRLVSIVPEAAEAGPGALLALLALAVPVGGMVALWLIDWRLGVAFLIGLPVAFVLVRLFIVRASDLFTRYQVLQSALASRLIDALSGVRTIRAGGTADREVERILTPLPELAHTGQALWCAQRGVTWQVGLLAPLMEIMVLAVAGFGVVAGRITPGELLAVAGYVGLAMGLLTQLDSLVQLAQARGSARRIQEVLAEPPSAGLTGARSMPSGPGELVFRDVTVRVGDTVVLEDLDLTVPAGTTLALVGPSGSGKTTLAYLVGRLVEPDEGDVFLDGVPLRELDPAALRRQVAYAFDRPAPLGRTIADAIGYGYPEAVCARTYAATMEREEIRRIALVQAAVAAHADNFIRRLPAGYDTPLPEAPMSGGQAQRLGLARALAQASGGGRVLVLDDATSSLDTATEAQVAAALAELTVNRTCLIVAHRTATAARSDLVAWLDGGRLRRLAPHSELWASAAYRAVFAGGIRPMAGLQLKRAADPAGALAPD